MSTVNKRGRPRSQRDWNQNFKLNALVGFTKHPAVHTFLFVNMENEQLSEIVAKALEDYLRIHAPEYFNAEYQAEVVREARARETEKLMQTLRPEADQVEILRPSIPVPQQKEEPTLASSQKKEEVPAGITQRVSAPSEEVPTETVQRVSIPGEEEVSEQRSQTHRGGLFATVTPSGVTSEDVNPGEGESPEDEQAKAKVSDLADRFTGGGL